MDRQDYNCKALELLDDKDTYRPILKDLNPQIQKSTHQLTQKLQNLGTNHPGHLQKTLYPTCAPIPKFYGLPKIHKTGTP